MGKFDVLYAPLLSRRLHISRRCILQTIRKHHEFHTVATKSGAGRPPKVKNV